MLGGALLEAAPSGKRQPLIENCYVEMAGLNHQRGKDSHLQDYSISKKTTRFSKGRFTLIEDPKSLTKDMSAINYAGGGLVVKRPWGP